MIVDVEIYNGRIRQVKDFSLTAATLEEKLLAFGYSGEGRAKDERVESMMLPPIALIFYSYLYETLTIPSDLSLVDEYFKQPYFEYVPDGKVEVTYADNKIIVSMDAVIGRVLRTYPSLVRDLHFYLMAKESGIFSDVHYSFKKDYYDKIDLRVKYQEKWYSVGLMLGSKRSMGYKFKKIFRHKPVDTIDMELYEQEAQRVGDYLLYTQNHINKLIQIIKSKK